MKTIIFDMDETLYSYSICFAKAIEVIDQYCQRELGWEPGEMKTLWPIAYKEITEHLGYDNASIHDTMLRIQNVCEKKGVNPLMYARKIHQLFWDTVIDTMEPYEGVISFIKKAKEEGYCLGIATDLTAEIQYRKLEKLNLCEYFDFIVTSEEAGCEKPHRGIFEACLKKSGCAAEECLMLGDNWNRDIVGALDMGMRARWHVPGRELSEIDVEKRPLAFSSFITLEEEELS